MTTSSSPRAGSAICSVVSAWRRLCKRQGIAATRSATLQEVIDELPLAEHPHAGSYRVIPPPVRYSKTPASVHRPAALVGEHGASVLAEAGYDEAEIAALREAGVLGGGGEAS